MNWTAGSGDIYVRKIQWRQMNRSWTRAQTLIARGLPEETAIQSSFNQRGAWWNSGARHLNFAYPIVYFDRSGLDIYVYLRLGHEKFDNGLRNSNYEKPQHKIINPLTLTSAVCQKQECARIRFSQPA